MRILNRWNSLASFVWQILNVNRFFCYFFHVRSLDLFTFCKCRHEKAISIFFSFFFFFYLDTEYNVYQSDVTRSGKKCWELVKLVSASCKLIYALHVPDSSLKLAARRRLIPVDRRQV